MSLGQSMLAAGALVVITILVINTHRVVIQSKEDELRSIALRIAGDAASSLINEALKEPFDDKATTNYYQNVSEFTLYNHLGPETTPSFSLPDKNPYQSINSSSYDDFDDYNNYSRTVDDPMMKGFILHCTVYYVDTVNLNNKVFGSTYLKRLIVKVVNPVFMKGDTLSFSVIKSY